MQRVAFWQAKHGRICSFNVRNLGCVQIWGWKTQRKQDGKESVGGEKLGSCVTIVDIGEATF